MERRIGFYEDELAIMGRLSPSEAKVMERILRFFLETGNRIGLDGEGVKDGALGLIGQNLMYSYSTERPNRGV